MDRMTSERIDLMAPLFESYGRKFTVLDLGCGDGSIMRAIRERWRSAVVFGLDRDGDAAIMKADINGRTLEEMTGIEHFDVVVAFNFLHHFKDDWLQATMAVMELGHHVLIQLPPPGTERVAGEEILSDLCRIVERDSEFLGSTWYPSFHHDRPMWRITNGNLWQVTWAARPWMVVHGFDVIQGMRGSTSKPWIPGINIWTLHGLGADRKWLVEQIEKSDRPDREHGDILPWNFIWDGERAHLIDFQDEPGGHWARDDKLGYEETIRMLSAEENDLWDQWSG